MKTAAVAYSKVFFKGLNSVKFSDHEYCSICFEMYSDGSRALLLFMLLELFSGILMEATPIRTVCFTMNWKEIKILNLILCIWIFTKLLPKSQMLLNVKTFGWNDFCNSKEYDFLILLSSAWCVFPVKQDLNFLDKDTQFYRFQDSELGLNNVSKEKDLEDELHEALSLLSQLGPDALLTMILRKWSASKSAGEFLLCIYVIVNSHMFCLDFCDVAPVQKRKTARCHAHWLFVGCAVPVRGALRISRSSTRSCSMWRLLLISQLQSVNVLLFFYHH